MEREAQAEEKAQAERERQERITQMEDEQREREKAGRQWEIERVLLGTDKGKPCAYYAAHASTGKADLFLGTEEELLAKYPELTGQRY